MQGVLKGNRRACSATMWVYLWDEPPDEPRITSQIVHKKGGPTVRLISVNSSRNPPQQASGHAQAVRHIRS